MWGPGCSHLVTLCSCMGLTCASWSPAVLWVCPAVACDPDSPWSSRGRHRVAQTSAGPVRAWPALWCARDGLGVLTAAHICRCAACERPASPPRAIASRSRCLAAPRPASRLPDNPLSRGVWDAASSASGASPQATCSRLPPPSLPAAPSLPRLVQPTCALPLQTPTPLPLTQTHSQRWQRPRRRPLGWRAPRRRRAHTRSSHELAAQAAAGD